MAFAPALLAPPSPEVQDQAAVADIIDPQALGASLVLPPPPLPPAAAELPLDALAAAASAPPPAAPLSPVDAALAPALPPEGGPALSLLPPPEAVPGAAAAPMTPESVAAGNVKKTEELGAEQVANAEAKAAQDTEAAKQEAAFKAEAEARRQKLLDRQETHLQAANAEVAAARAKAESEPFHTFWETRGIGQNIATGIGLVLGGVSWNANHVNRGVDMLEKAMALDLQLQKEKHADLWRAVNEAQEGVRTLDAQQLHELSAFAANEGAKHDALASRLAAAAAMNKGKGDVTAVKKLAIEEIEKANQFYQQAANAGATANHLKEVEEAKRREDAEAARHHAEQEKTAALRAAKYKTKGGGGGGGGKATDNAITAMQTAADEKGATLGTVILAGKGLPQKERERLAKDMLAAKTRGENTERKELTLSEKDRDKVVRDPDTKQPYAIAGTSKLAEKHMTRDVQLGDAAHRMEELADDVKKYGARVDPSDLEAVQRRLTKFKNAIIAVGIVSPLGKTNETLHLETGVLGPTGTVNEDGLKKYILSTGAYLPGIEEKAKEMRHNRQSYRNTLTPLSPEEVKKWSGSSAPAAKTVKPPAGSKFGKLSDGSAVAKYPDGTYHRPDGSEVTVL